jgi:hypothetical protein
MKTKIAAALLAALTLGTTVVAGSGQAQAHGWGGWGWGGAGFAAGALVGAAVATSGPCHWVRQYDRYGNYVGTAKVCNTY